MQFIGTLDWPYVRRATAAMRALSARLEHPPASSSRGAGMSGTVGPAALAPDPGCIPLRDGRRVTVRPLEPAAAARFQQFIRDLSPAARTQRFHSAFREAPASLIRALIPDDHNGQVAWVAQECAREGPIVAEARYATADGEAEFALAVADAWRRQGLGRALLSGLLRRAAVSGIRRVWGYVRRDNEPMLRLAANAGFELHISPDDPSILIAEQHLEGAAGFYPAAAGRPLTLLPKRAMRVLLPSLTAQARRWIRAYRLPIFAALLVPGGMLVAVMVALARLWRLRAERRDAAASLRATAGANDMTGEVRASDPPPPDREPQKRLILTA